jgi:manganese/zinc/iron transport system substrate-binding protein
MTSRRDILRIAATASALGALTRFAGCMRGESLESGGKLHVATSTTMVGDLARRIGGERTDVRIMMGPGVDPHTFKPAPGDIAELVAAPLIFYSGLHLEGKMVELFEDRVAHKAFAITAAIPHEKLLAWSEGEAGAHDPHVWFDVSLWATAVPLVRDRLIAADPAGAAIYRRNAEAIAASLAALHEEVKATLGRVPKEKRVLVTSHDAYSYFGKAYDVEVRGVQGISTETEAGLREVNEAVDFIVRRKIPALFVETSVNHKTIQQIRADCQRRGMEVEIGGELYSDAMGAVGDRPGYAVETYEGMVRYNVDTIANALLK